MKTPTPAASVGIQASVQQVSPLTGAAIDGMAATVRQSFHPIHPIGPGLRTAKGTILRRHLPRVGDLLRVTLLPRVATQRIMPEQPDGVFTGCCLGCCWNSWWGTECIVLMAPDGLWTIPLYSVVGFTVVACL